MKKERLLVIAGPTASGKTSLSLRLASDLEGEILSGDSMQVYRGMDIGTAKATPAERACAPHHLIDIADPKEDWNVVRFTEAARPVMAEISARGHLPILVGGTGFYIDALVYATDFTEEGENTALRKELESLAREEGPQALHAQLAQLDPDSAAAIHPNNVKRVIRALEFIKTTGLSMARHNLEERERKSPYDLCYLVLAPDRQRLYRRIDERVLRMMDEGLVEEVKRLLDEGVPLEGTAMQGIGYKEIAAYLRGDTSLGEAVELIQKRSRHYAKRQLTWFKRNEEAVFIDPDNTSYEEIRDRICRSLSKTSTTAMPGSGSQES